MEGMGPGCGSAQLLAAFLLLVVTPLLLVAMHLATSIYLLLLLKDLKIP